jgi:hypothetical protein
LKFLTLFSEPLVAVGIAKVGKEFDCPRGSPNNLFKPLCTILQVIPHKKGIAK